MSGHVIHACMSVTVYNLRSREIEGDSELHVYQSIWYQSVLKNSVNPWALLGALELLYEMSFQMESRRTGRPVGDRTLQSGQLSASSSPLKSRSRAETRQRRTWQSSQLPAGFLPIIAVTRFKLRRLRQEKMFRTDKINVSSQRFGRHEYREYIKGGVLSALTGWEQIRYYRVFREA